MLLSILFSQLNFDLNSKVFGHYPASLSDLPTFDERRSNDQNFPWILEEVSAKYPMVKLSITWPLVDLLPLYQGIPFYKSEEGCYEFSFTNPADIGTQKYVYHSLEGIWQLLDTSPLAQERMLAGKAMWEMLEFPDWRLFIHIIYI